ncbi:MAG: universal stress protein [Desulfobacterales bacterium]
MTNPGIKKLLVAIDGSDQALDAVRYVKNILGPEGTQVVLYHALRQIDQAFWDMGINPMGRTRMTDIVAWEAEQRKGVEEGMGHARKILEEAGFDGKAIRVELHPAKVGIARDILYEAQSGYSAVVLGRWGVSRLKDIVVGSTALKLIQKSQDVPVWMVGGKPKPGKVLVAFDGSEGAGRAVDHVAQMALGGSFDITLMSVVKGFGGTGAVHEAIFSSENEKGLLVEIDREMHEKLDHAKNRMVTAGVPAERIQTELLTGVASRSGAIYEAAKRGGFGTIVVGRRGLSRIQEFYMGRVGNKVMQMAREMAIWVVS